MTDDRFRLLFGLYATPVFQYGEDAFCELHGAVILCGLTDARIPWPIGKKRQKGSPLIPADARRPRFSSRSPFSEDTPGQRPAAGPLPRARELACRADRADDARRYWTRRNANRS